MMDPEASELMPASLGSLPTELVLDICEVLANIHASSLVRFSRTCRRYYHLSQPLIVRAVRIDDHGSDADVARCVAEWLQRLRRDDVTGNVSRLVLGMKPRDHHTTFAINRDNISTIFSVDELLQYERDLVESASCGIQTYHTEERWEPIVGLIRELPQLRDLVYACNGQFPIRLLRTLAAHRPTCKLHLCNFTIWSGWNCPDQTPEATFLELDPRELELITSPLIHTICYSDSLSPAYSGPLGQLVRGLTPNLKVLRGGSPPGDYWDGASGFKIRLRTRDIKFQPRIGSLESLEIHHPSTDAFKQLRSYTDLSCLRALRIKALKEDCSVTELADLLRGVDTGRLETLRFVTGHKPDWVTIPGETLEWFLGLVRNLTSLVLGWHCTPFLSRIVGPTLRELHIVGGDRTDSQIRYLSRHELAQLGRNCPILEDLSVPIRRTQGSAEEVASYTALGRFFPRLQHLTIYLAVADPRERYPRPVGGNGVMELLSQHEWSEQADMDYLLNLAVDENLALSVFHVISASRSLQVVQGKVLLKTLDLLPRPMSLSQTWEPIKSSLARQWRVCRSTRDDTRDQLCVREKAGTPGMFSCSYHGSTKYLDYQWSLYQKIWPTESSNPSFLNLGQPSDGTKWPLTGWKSVPLDIEGFQRLEEEETGGNAKQG
ncbi:hypothetical protein V8F20_005099 [Naviculisporaceae sp. PSN 640]